MRKHWLIGYDITHVKRLGRVRRLFAKHATRIQNSVYLFSGSTRELSDFLSEVEAIIDINRDDVRAYPMTDSCLLYLAGKGSEQNGILLIEGRGIERLELFDSER